MTTTTGRRKITNLPNWRLFARCDECGAEPKAACRDLDDEAQTVPCDGRAVIKPARSVRKAKEARAC